MSEPESRSYGQVKHAGEPHRDRVIRLARDVIVGNERSVADQMLALLLLYTWTEADAGSDSAVAHWLGGA